MAFNVWLYYCTLLYTRWHLPVGIKEQVQVVWQTGPLHGANPRYKETFFINIHFKKYMEKKKTLVIGASENPARYSYLAVQKLNAHQQPVIALGLRKGMIGNTAIETEKKAFDDVGTVTLYLNPSRQKEYYD